MQTFAYENVVQRPALRDAAARRGIDLKHQIKLLKRRLKYQPAPLRVFPDFKRLINDIRTGAFVTDTPATINDDGEVSHPLLTSLYVADYCRLNKLKG
jgi:hypothetical protein